MLGGGERRKKERRKKRRKRGRKGRREEKKRKRKGCKHDLKFHKQSESLKVKIKKEFFYYSINLQRERESARECVNG